MQLDPQTQAMLKDIALGQLRHYLTIAGTALASYGVLGCQGCVSESQFVATASGIAIAGLGAAWSWWEKTGSVQAQARAVQLVAQLEARKQAAAKAYADAQAVQQALAPIPAVRPTVAAPSPAPTP